MIIQPVPLSQQDLGHYIAYLLCRLCFTSVRQYLNIVRLLHIKSGFANPLDNNWYSAASVTFRFVSLVSMTHLCVSVTSGNVTDMTIAVSETHR